MRCAFDVLVQPQGEIPVGTEVFVSVVARVDEPANCRGLRCEAFWEASRLRPPDAGLLVEAGLLKAGTDTGFALSEQAAGGALQPGTPLTTTFRFVVPPEGPVSYRGRWIAIEWRLRIALDLAGREDPAHVETLTVVPA